MSDEWIADHSIGRREVFYRPESLCLGRRFRDATLQKRLGGAKWPNRSKIAPHQGRPATVISRMDHFQEKADYNVRDSHILLRF
jgi:hypothetical protein